MSDIAIRIEGLSKRYRIGRRETYQTLRDSLTDFISTPFRRISSRSDSSLDSDPDYIWALRDVSLEIKSGEVVGIVGRNGAGKSTLLKVLSRITEPTEGYAEILGRVGALLEVGTGFHSELTGRENIYLNGAILGMKKAEIDAKFGDIVSFAEVDKFIDTPVKRYSSGMHVRLAFAVAAHLEPQILVVDEVLAVGDAAFQEKCLGRMSEVSREGRTVLFVSHNMNAILKLCNRAIWLDRGVVVRDDIAEDVVRNYLKEVKKRRTSSANGLSLDGHPGRWKVFDGIIRLTHCKVLGIPSDETGLIRSGGECRIILGYETKSPLSASRVNFVVSFRGENSKRLASCSSQLASREIEDLGAAGEVECRIPRLPLMPGQYVLDIGCQVGPGWADMIYEAATLEVVGGHFYPSGRLPAGEMGECLMDYEWSRR